jgi:hypothetical protein
MNAPPPTQQASAAWQQRWQQFSAACLRGFHSYANWLVGISWRRFIVLAVALLVIVGILHDLPPFTWTFTERVQEAPRVVVVPPLPPPREPRLAKPPGPPDAPQPPDTPVRIELPKKGAGKDGIEINIGKEGIRIKPRRPAEAAASAAASAAAAADQAQQAADAAASASQQGIQIQLPPGVASEAVREAVEQARREIEASIREAREDAEAAANDAAEARRDAEAAIGQLADQQRRGRHSTRTRRIGIGDLLMQLTFLWDHRLGGHQVHLTRAACRPK